MKTSLRASKFAKNCRKGICVEEVEVHGRLPTPSNHFSRISTWFQWGRAGRRVGQQLAAEVNIRFGNFPLSACNDRFGLKRFEFHADRVISTLRSTYQNDEHTHTHTPETNKSRGEVSGLEQMRPFCFQRLLREPPGRFRACAAHSFVQSVPVLALLTEK